MISHYQYQDLYLDHLTTIGGDRYLHLWLPYKESQFLCEEYRFTLTNDNVNNVFIWSDQHFGHKNVIKYSNRPFSSVDEMNETMLTNYNSVVGENDVCFWCGDVTFMGITKSNDILSRCNGYKILIVGNHDFNKKKVQKYTEFSEKHLSYCIEYNNKQYLLTHYPMGNVPSNLINIHGHIHDRESPSSQHVNVCVEHLNYQPVPIKDVLI